MTFRALSLPGVLGRSRTALGLERLRWRIRLNALSRHGGRRIALASFPRSGNTWFRFLLENATGEMTGNASDRPSRILPRGREGIVIKTHRRDSFQYTHAVHLVRNPFDVLDSFYDWKESLGWEWKYGRMSWEEFVRLMMPKWREHTRHWLKAKPERYLIRYEDCVKDPMAQFSALLDWCGRPIPAERLQAAIESSSFERLKQQQSAETALGSRFFRRGRAERGLERFSAEQRAWATRLVETELRACGYNHLLG